MLTHFFLFLYIFITSYTIGRYFTDKLLLSVVGEEGKLHPALYSATGLAYITVLAGFFSLFAPIGLLFNILICGLALLSITMHRKQLFSNFTSNTSSKGMTITVTVFFLFTLLFVLVKSSGIITNPDTGGYHLQLVKWVEEYPVIKGLANVQTRFGFNYQYLVLCAVYGFSFLGIPTLHAVNGYIMILLVSYIITTLGIVKTGKLLRQDVIKFIVLFFVINMSNATSSLSPDFPASAYAIFVVLLMLDKAMDGSFFVFDSKAFIVFIISICAVIFKISVLPIVLFNLAFILPTIKNSKQIITLIILGIVGIAPFLLRNYFISGYLVYPLYELDIFNVPWKVPYEAAVYEKEVVKYYTLNLPVGTKLDFKTMWHAWFAYMRMVNPVYVYIVYVLIGCIALNILMLVYTWISKTIKQYLPLVIINAILLASILYWFQLGPDLRFGNGYIIPFIAITLGLLFYKLVNRVPASATVYIAITAFLLFETAMLKGAAISKAHNNRDNTVSVNAIWQAPYPVPDTVAVFLSTGQKIYKDRQNVTCWDACLPCAFESADFRMIGKTPHEGFLPAIATK